MFSIHLTQLGKQTPELPPPLSRRSKEKGKNEKGRKKEEKRKKKGRKNGKRETKKDESKEKMGKIKWENPPCPGEKDIKKMAFRGYFPHT
jgi:hypothetical protein